MPTLETMPVNPALDFHGKTAHAQRTADRIDALERQMQAVVPNDRRAPGQISREAELAQIAWELQLLHVQLTDPRTKRELLAEGKLPPPPRTVNVEEAKDRVRAMEAKGRPDVTNELVEGLALMVKSLREELHQLKATDGAVSGAEAPPHA